MQAHFLFIIDIIIFTFDVPATEKVGDITINQAGYIDRMLERFQIVNCKPAKTPLNSSLPLRKATSIDKRTDQKSYQELTGSLNHAAVF